MNKLISKIVSLSVVLVCVFINTYAQENLDVLPETGRRELFHAYLLNQLDSLVIDRQNAVTEALTSKENLESRQQQIKKDYLSLLGQLPEKAPLDAVIVDTITNNDVYRIERLHYQSLPNHHVTANFYIPDTGTAPYPTVIITCGHYPVAKTYTDYQKLAILFARSGIAALIVDPIAQGERYQITKPTGDLAYIGGSGTTEHSLLDVGAVLTGTSVVAYELWDNHRGVDYLYSRTDVVDTSQIGCTGHSGGGAQATYLLAFDDRLKVGAVANFLMNEKTLFNTIGPQTGSQNLSYEGAYTLDHPDYISMFAPKPYLIIATTNALFEISGTYETYDEVKVVYDTLGVPEKVSLFVTNDVHDYTKVKREKAVRWFKSWFYNNNDTIIEGEQATLSRDDLTVTESGQVMYEWDDELSVNDLNSGLADSLADDRKAFWSENTKDSCLNMVKTLMVYEPYGDELIAADSGTIDRGEYTIEKINIISGEDVPVTGLLFSAKSKPAISPTILYVDGRGKKTDAEEGKWIEKLVVDSGYIVFAIDVRGFGETADLAGNESKHLNKEHRNTVISLYNGKTMIGQRVADVMKALDVLTARTDVDVSKISIVGIDRAGPVVMHAAALEDKFQEVTIRLSDSSWVDIVNDPSARDKMTHLVPSALLYYDLPELVSSISPRPVHFAEEPIIEEPIERVETNSLAPNLLKRIYPNPASDVAIITYSLPKAGDIILKLYDRQGRELDTLVDEYQIARDYTINHSISDLVPGTYFYRMSLSGNPVGTFKMLVLP